MSRLLVREKVFTVTGKDFEVKAGFFTGPVYTIEGDHTSFHDRRKLFDSNGRRLLEMKTKILSARRNVRIKRADNGDVVVTMRRSTYVPIAVRREGRIDVWRGEKVDSSPWLEILGEKGGDRFPVMDMWRGGREIAVIHKKQLTLPTLFLGKSSYILEIEKGYEEPLLVMMTLAIDAYYSD